ncbi:MAG: FAD-dependent monooxygenase [Gammaproteobacteria bacterium]|nr:FAD-dependent monooxygenase [Gammaproteobacteria bacterium]
MSLPVLIVGGGIGGLCASLALGQHGIPTIVFERNRFEDRSGAGIQLSPNATRLLFQIGLQDDLMANSMSVTDVLTRDWKSGRAIARLPLGEIVENRCGFPYVQILRSTLVRILLQGVQNNPNIQLLQEDEVVELCDSGGQVTISSPSGQYCGVLVVGADGMRSTVRRLMGTNYNPPYSGWVAWRTILNREDEVQSVGKETTVWCGPKGHIVHYPIDDIGNLNCVFITRSRAELRDSWGQQGSVSELRQYFARWHKDVGKLIDAIDQHKLYRWGLFRHNQIPGGWTKGRGTLLGDACHCILPFLAQGAALAIEDAFALAQCVTSDTQNPMRAIVKYEAVRRARARKIQKYSELVGMAYHMPKPWSWLRDLGSRIALERLSRTIYNYDALESTRSS